MTALVSKVLELTDRVEAAIESGDWSLAQELETERRRLLEQLASASDAGCRCSLFGCTYTRFVNDRSAWPAHALTTTSGTPDVAR